MSTLKPDQSISKAVKRVKKGYLNIRQEKLEQHLLCPKNHFVKVLGGSAVDQMFNNIKANTEELKPEWI